MLDVPSCPVRSPGPALSSNLAQIHPTARKVGPTARAARRRRVARPLWTRPGPRAEIPAARGSSRRTAPSATRTPPAPTDRLQAAPRARAPLPASPRHPGRHASIQAVACGSCQSPRAAPTERRAPRGALSGASVEKRFISVRPQIVQEVAQALAGFEEAGLHRLLVDVDDARDLLVTAFCEVPEHDDRPIRRRE